MRITITLGLCLLIYSVAAQETTLEVAYSLSLKQPDPVSTKARFIVRGTTSFFIWGNTSGALKTDQKEDGELVMQFHEPDTVGTINWMDLATGVLSTRFKQLGKSYLLQESIPKMTWHLQQPTRKIAGFLCNKAETQFRGRKYTVWFTPDIPLVQGPWKFNGLPGLILEAYDEERFLYLSARSIVTGSRPTFPDPIVWQVDETLDLMAFKKLQENLVQEIFQKIFSKMPRGVEVSLDSSEAHFLEKEFER